jgi:hypothetical protein
MSTWRRHPTLSLTLLSLVVTLLVATVGAIAVVGSIFQSRSIDDLQRRTISATTLIVGFVVNGYAAPGRPPARGRSGRARRVPG